MLKFKTVWPSLISGIREIYKSKYFYSFLAVVGFCAASLVVSYMGSAPALSRIKEGDISLRTIYAPYDFTYPTSIDKEKTEETRMEVEARIPPVYDIDLVIQDRVFAKLDNLFVGTEIKDIHKMQKVAKDALENIFLIGIMKKIDKDTLLGEKEEKVSVRNTRFDIEREVEARDLIDEDEADKIVCDTLESMIPRDRSMRDFVYNLIKNEIAANMRFNEGETKARKEKAGSRVLPVYKRDAVKKNELIVERGKRLTKDDIAKLAQITRIHAVGNRTAYISGLFILLMGLILIASVYLRFFEREIARLSKNIFLVSINAFLAILVSLLVVHSQVPGYIIPLASVGMILVLLLNARTAFITVFAMSIYIGFIAGGRLDLTFMLLLGGSVGMYAVRGARRRSRIFFAGFAVALANFFSIVGIGLLNNMQKEAILGEGFYGMANGLISSFIVIGLLPVFEYTFRLLTNIKLLELSDLTNPLLRELTIRAPGTYHHSILVGNLAVEACDKVGANSLLARIGSYYHDVGKIEKAAYFVENEIGTASKHDKLTASMSALIITNHVKDGVELARKHKLNETIVDFISQHHGTSLIYYFYQRALEKADSERELNEEEFRYPGPKPQSKETAIVLLADSVEASSRMLSDPTPARIKGLVEKIMNNKFIDGQLDECDLTLKDLHKISGSFVRVLMGIFHTRLEYPEVKLKKERKHASKDKSK